MARKSLRITFISSEAAPYSKTGGLADVAESLPQTLASFGHTVTLFLPYYRQTQTGNFTIGDSGKRFLVSLGNKSIAFSLYRCRRKKVSIYFVKQDEYFDREGLYGTALGDYPDNALRFAFFSKAVLASLEELSLASDIIHCNEWHTALTPFYLTHWPAPKTFFKGTKTIFTIHNLIYQGLFPQAVSRDVDIDNSFIRPSALEYNGGISFIKAGLLYSDVLTAVSKGYAREILTKKFGCGLHEVIKKRRKDLYGIINGVDYTQWNPETDRFIKTQYDSKTLIKKNECKNDVVRYMGLGGDEKAPLFGNVSRLVPNKGIDYIVKAVPFMVEQGWRLIVLGLGDEYHNSLLRKLTKRYPAHIAVKIGFDERLAHKIEAGADIYLMPSRYEPCGLNQLYSLKYGTIPVVGAVGGLDDTIVDYSESPESGNGFKFIQPSQRNFCDALKRAVSLYRNTSAWKRLMVRAMKCDFSWQRSAREYEKVYTVAMKGR